MATKKKTKKKKLNLNTIKGLFCICVAIGCMFLTGRTIVRYFVEKQEYNAQVAEKESYEEDIKDLQEDVKNSEDEDYIIQSARNRYGFTESGEEVVKLPKSEE